MFKKRNISSELMGNRNQHEKGNIRAENIGEWLESVSK